MNPSSALCSGCHVECETKVCSDCHELVVSCNTCSAIPESAKCSDCVGSVHENGAPPSAILMGIGMNTRGIEIMVREEQPAGSAMLKGEFKFMTRPQELSSLLEDHAGEHLPYTLYKELRKALLKSRKNSVEEMRQVFADRFHEDSAASIEKFLFHSSQWVVKH